MRNEPLTHALRDALHVTSLGLTAVSNRTEVDVDAGIRCISGGAARELRALNLIRDVAQWNAVEITDLGRDVLSGVVA